MLLLDRLGAGGSYTEFYALDFDDEFVLMGHDGPGHLAIAEGRPVARALKLYHGKSGAGLSIEMKVRLGPVTILGVTQTADGRLKLIAAEGESIAGPTFKIGNTNSRIRFASGPAAFFDAWCARGPDPPRRARRRSPAVAHPQGRRPARPRAGRRRVAARARRATRFQPGCQICSYDDRMAFREVRASGLEYLALATELLQRARLTDPEAGFWEAADLQWWWRTPRRSDSIDQLFWIDDEGPVAGVVLTDWGRAWGCDPIVVPGAGVSLADVWARAVEAIDGLGLEAVEVLARDDDVELLEMLAGTGFVAGDERSGTTWMDAADRPDVAGSAGRVRAGRPRPSG